MDTNDLNHTVVPGPELIVCTLNSAKHEILNAHMYTNIKESSFFGLRQPKNVIFPAHKS